MSSALTQSQRYIQAAQGLDPAVMVSTVDYVSQYTQLPEHWEHDINPGSGNSRATYIGEVFCGGQGTNNRVATIGDIAAATTGVSSFNTRTGAVVLTLADVTGVGGAPINNTALQGSPTAATQAQGTSNTTLATTAFVTQALANQPGVYSWNGRQGAITMTLSDVTAAGGAPNASPIFTGIPQGPTAPLGTDNQQLATTAFVMTQLGNTVTSWNGRVGNVTLTLSDVTSVGGAPINAPAFTGVPTAPTATAGTATTQLATTQFVTNAVQAATVGVASFNTRTGAVTLQPADISGAGGALLAGPALTGNPTAPTQPAGTNNTTLATTAFVETAITGAAVVSSFNGRTGAVALSSADVANAGALMETGGTMSGPIVLAGNANTALNPVPLQQLTSVTAGYLPLAGGTLTGPLTLAANASANMQAVPYQQLVSYTSGSYLPLTGGTLNPGPLVVQNPAGQGTIDVIGTTGAANGASMSLIAPTGTFRNIFGNVGSAAPGSARWAITLGNNAAESGSNAGSDFTITNYTDAGVAITTCMAITRATGNTTFSCPQVGVANAAGATLALNATGGATAVTFTAQGSQSSQVYADGTYFGIGESGPFPSASSWRYMYVRSSGDRYWLNFQATNLMHLDPGGNLTILGSLSQGSDAALKENIAPADDCGLSQIRAMLPKRFTRKQAPRDVEGAPPEAPPPPRLELGFIAQDVAVVLPEAVITKQDGLLALDIMPFIGALVNAVKELAERVETLETKLA